MRTTSIIILNVLCWILAVIIVVVILSKHQGNIVTTEAIRDTVYDTIPYYTPILRDSVVCRHVTVRLPTSNLKTLESVPKSRENAENDGKSVPNIDEEDNFPNKEHIADVSNTVAHLTNEVSKTDSADVVIPITQKVYEDSLYRAYVSGFRASLDSLILYPRTEIVTLTNAKPKNEPKFSWGLQMGIGVTPKGVQPYVGAGIQLNF